MSLCWSVTRLISLDCSIQCTVALVEQLGVAVNWLLESMRWQFPARWSVWGRKFSCRARIMCRKWNLLWRKTLMHIARIVVSDTSVWSLKLQLWFDIHWLRSRMSLLSKSLINASGFATANEDWCNHTHEQACVESRDSWYAAPAPSAIDRYLLPARRSAENKPYAAAVNRKEWNTEINGRTPDCYIG